MDFVFLEHSGQDKRIGCIPSYASYSASGNGYGFNATGYAVGAQVYEHSYPWAVFSIWNYTEVSLGFEVDDAYRMVNFPLKSHARDSGLKKGDVVLGIDGIGICDSELGTHLLLLKPDDRIVLIIERGEKVRDYSVQVSPN